MAHRDEYRSLVTEERARLRPLKTAPADLALRSPVSVSPMGV
jgi:hypothetical protein